MSRKSGLPTKRPKEADSVAHQTTIFATELRHLHFDPANPRFAHRGMEDASEVQILDETVRTYGVEDVISSIAVNGYLETEPLVGVRLKKNSDDVRVMEGNRRLAALLILANDPRAKNHDKLRELHHVHHPETIDPVPVVVYDPDTEPEQLLPYLGVRHIVGTRAWDSYAKAAWVADVLRRFPTITLAQIEEMLGDSRGTIRRILEGYYLVAQLQESDRFHPADSVKKGKGSLGDFPFSWVYNAIGYRKARDFIGLGDGEPKPDPVRHATLDNAADLMLFMFGSRAKQKAPVIKESRELADLALCLGDRVLVAQLRNGTPVSNVLWQSKTGLDRVLQSLDRADTNLGEAVKAVPELGRADATNALPLADKVRSLAIDVRKRIAEKSTAPEDGSDDDE